ncbi:MAG: sorbosone dehydrogenase family protein, partial [Cyclobacteriaceae bacterium]
MKKQTIAYTVGLAALFFSCNNENTSSMGESDGDSSAQSYEADTVETAIGELILPAPFATESTTKRNEMVAWPDDTKPTAPEGFEVTKFATDFDNPRWTYIAPNGDIFVSEADTKQSADKITLLRDNNGDGTIDLRETFLEDLNQPFGMLIIGNAFYVANTDGLYKYPYQEGQTS